MIVSEIYGSEIMSSKDIEDGSVLDLIISGCGLYHDVRNGKRIRLSFTNHEKDMVLNKTNAAIMEGKIGPDTDDWIGKLIRVGLAATRDLQGKPCMGLSVLSAGKAPKKNKSNNDTFDEE